MGPIALFVVVVILPVAAVLSVGALWISTWITDLPLLIVPLTLVAAVAGGLGGRWLGRRLAGVGEPSRPGRERI